MSGCEFKLHTRSNICSLLLHYYLLLFFRLYPYHGDMCWWQGRPPRWLQIGSLITCSYINYSSKDVSLAHRDVWLEASL